MRLSGLATGILVPGDRTLQEMGSRAISVPGPNRYTTRDLTGFRWRLPTKNNVLGIGYDSATVHRGARLREAVAWWRRGRRRVGGAIAAKMTVLAGTADLLARGIGGATMAWLSFLKF